MSLTEAVTWVLVVGVIGATLVLVHNKDFHDQQEYECWKQHKDYDYKKRSCVDRQRFYNPAPRA